MILDPILRFNWVFYVAFPVELQHSAILAFIISLTEIARRGMWTIFRVENEHCTNVGRFRASRDVPLPYKLKKHNHDEEGSDEELLEEDEEDQKDKNREAEAESRGMGHNRLEHVAAQASEVAGIGKKHSRNTNQGPSGSSPAATGVDLERQPSAAVDSLRRRQTGTKESLWRRGGMSVRERVGQILRRAHAQDFERRRNVDEAQGEDSDDEDEQQADEERESDAEDLQGDDDQQEDVTEQEMDRRTRSDMDDAEVLLRRARGGDGV